LCASAAEAGSLSERKERLLLLRRKQTRAEKACASAAEAGSLSERKERRLLLRQKQARSKERRRQLRRKQARSQKKLFCGGSGLLRSGIVGARPPARKALRTRPPDARSVGVVAVPKDAHPPSSQMVAMGLGLRIYAATELEYGAPMSLSKQSSVSGPRLMSKRAKDNKDKLESEQRPRRPPPPPPPTPTTRYTDKNILRGGYTVYIQGDNNILPQYLRIL
jgi:hypothetical protein